MKQYRNYMQQLKSKDIYLKTTHAVKMAHTVPDKTEIHKLVKENRNEEGKKGKTEKGKDIQNKDIKNCSISQTNSLSVKEGLG